VLLKRRETKGRIKEISSLLLKFLILFEYFPKITLFLFLNPGIGLLWRGRGVGGGGD